jgi:hypothetical protein
VVSLNAGASTTPTPTPPPSCKGNGKKQIVGRCSQWGQSLNTSPTNRTEALFRL